tara:strand:+ start:362 stop:904 length:543 start_codon:yes stop_codon:yes gene_type:complete
MSDTRNELRKAHLERRARIAAAAVPDTAPQRAAKQYFDYVCAKVKPVMELKKERVPVAPVSTPAALPMELPEMISPGILFVNYVQRYVAAHYGYKLDALVGPDRASSIARARHIAMYIIETLTNRSRADIGLRFGRDASSVFYATTKVRRLMEADPDLREGIAFLISRITEARNNSGRNA